MRYTNARILLGASLLVATSTAQDSAIPQSFGGASRYDAPTYTDAYGPSAAASTLPQGDVDYSLRGQFLQHHGDFMNRRQRYTPDVEIAARALPNQRVNNEPGSFDMLGYDFDATFRPLVSTDGYLTFGAYYKARRYLASSDFGDGGTNGNNGWGDETLYGMGGKFGFGVFLTDNVLLEAETHPGVWSDIDDTLHHQDFDFPSFAMFTVRSLDNFFFKFGARYNQVYEEAPWLPILGFSWELSDNLRLDVLAPERFELSLWPSQSFGLLFGGCVTGAEYHVHSSRTGLDRNQRANARVQEAIAYLGMLARINDNVSFQARGGIVIAGEYSLTTGANAFDPIDGPLDQGVYLEASLGISF
ncbi:MAG: DUF6268 family outer membrane beta-barrel protein [Planctomycetota bacterium]